METNNPLTILNPNSDTNIKVLIQSNYDCYIDTSFINILRKFIISNIETYTFYYINKENKNPNIKPIKINTNNINNLNNDMLGHRISLLPINIYALEILVLFSHYKKNKKYNLKEIEEFEISQDDLYDNELKFYIKKSYEDFDVENESNFISITDGNIKNDLFDILTTGYDKDIEKIKIRDSFIEYIFENEEDNSIISILNHKYDYDITDTEELKLLKLFKPYIDKNGKSYYNIITRIKINQQIDIDMYLMKNSVISDNYTENNIRYSPVAACRSTFAINYIDVLNIFNKNSKFSDEEVQVITQKIVDLNNLYPPILLNNDDLSELKIDNIDLSEFKRFCIEEAERYYYGKDNQINRVHILEYETLNFYKPKIILQKALKNLIDTNITTYHNVNIFKDIYNNINLNDILIKNTPLLLDKYKITKSSKLTPHLNNSIDILIYNGTHGLGYLMQTYINYNDKITNNIITYIGYKIIHPLENKLLISIQIKDNNNDSNYKLLKSLFKTTYDYLHNLIDNYLLKEIE